jgi:YegS/Rv2252/BmrU family lipid kinase
MKVLVIVNPVAGRGRAARGAERVARLLEARGHHVERLATRGAGDAARGAREREGAVGCFVVGGGDGTLSEVVNGLADPSRTPLLPVPTGTANNLARDLGIPRRDESLAQLVETGAVRRVDLGRVGGRRFLTTVSSGFDALVTEVVKRSRATRLGYRGYPRAILSALAAYRPPELVVQIDDAEPMRGALVVVSNVRRYGGLFVVTDRARCDSGHLDVCLARRATRRDLFYYGIAAALRRLDRVGTLEFRTGRRIRIEASRPAPVEVDGDYWGTTPVAIEVEPRVVPVLCPAAPAPDAAARG